MPTDDISEAPTCPDEYDRLGDSQDACGPRGETEHCGTAAQFQFSATPGSLDHLLAAKCVHG
ncbi:hypothetical protein QU41_00615 [Bradyrhizobium elkanii]|nr:hypothetical protein QU41_00615 [Bradyrhizobium elkanii]